MYTDGEKSRISSYNWSGYTVEGKFMRMVSYLFELGNELALSRKFNVPRSPGCEGCGLKALEGDEE